MKISDKTFAEIEKMAGSMIVILTQFRDGKAVLSDREIVRILGADGHNRLEGNDAIDATLVARGLATEVPAGKILSRRGQVLRMGLLQ